MNVTQIHPASYGMQSQQPMNQLTNQQQRGVNQPMNQKLNQPQPMMYYNPQQQMYEEWRQRKNMKWWGKVILAIVIIGLLLYFVLPWIMDADLSVGGMFNTIYDVTIGSFG